MNKKINGTVFDLDAAEGDWFTFFNSHIKDDGEIEFDDPIEGAGRFCLRPMGKFIEEHFAEQKTKSEFVLNKKSRAMERVTYSKDMTAEERKEYQACLWDYVIIDFMGVIDAKGIPVEATKENKSKLMAIPAVDRFVAKCLKTIGENAVREAEALTENL